MVKLNILSMKKLILNCLLPTACCLLIITGCIDYTSKVPLDSEKKSYLKPELIGTWEFVWSSYDTTDNGLFNKLDTHYLEIVSFNDKEYLIIYIDSDNKEQIKDLYKGYITKIGDYEFANVQPLKFIDTLETYYIIYKFEIAGDTLIYTGISDDFLKTKFEKSGAFKKYIKKNINNKDLWGVTRKYVKKTIGFDIEIF